jgi:hypothetical protein
LRATKKEKKEEDRFLSFETIEKAVVIGEKRQIG